jgi:hypothetical protein
VSQESFRLYKDYLIVGSSEYDYTTGDWQAIVLIFLKRDGSQLYEAWELADKGLIKSAARFPKC